MKKILFLGLLCSISVSLFAAPTTCPYQPKNCSDLGDSSFWQRCTFSDNPNTTALTEVRTSIIDKTTKDKAMQVICMYGKDQMTSLPLGLVVNLNAIIHLNNKNEWSKATDVQIPDAYSCTPHSPADCSFMVINQ